MKHVLFILSFVFAFGLNAQVLNNSKGEAFSNKPFFNTSFILNNKIKSIKGRFNYKKSGHSMYETEFYYAYNFNELGQLISTFETRKDDGSQDTTWNEYGYNSAGILIELKQGSATSKTTIHYVLDDKNRVVAEEHIAESVDSLGVKSAMIVNSETIKYEDFGLQTKKTWFNSYGLPYKSEMSYYDKNGYLLEQELTYIRTRNTEKKVYEYNENGYVTKIVTNKNIGGVSTSETEDFIYDNFGNLFEKHVHQGDTFVTDTQIVYNERTKLMTAVIIRDVKTDFLMVLRYGEYQYFNH